MRRPDGVAATTTTTALTPFPTVENRVNASTDLWANDLRTVFEEARDRFADISWESETGERVWAHKALVYVRAPKAFKDRYFINSSKPIAFSRSPTSLSTTSPYLSSGTSLRATPSPFGRRQGSSLSVDTTESDGTLRAPTLGGAGADGVLRLRHDDAPELFRAQLEWLYTGEGFGDVVEWISEPDGSSSVRDSLGRRGNLEERRDKLGQDLTYMWTSKLYCDVRIHLESSEDSGNMSDNSDASDDSLSSTVIFTAHRFILVSRSPYFASVLLNPSEFRPATADIHLPTPPFTPAALHFCLGWMYAGHLDFSNRSYDLLTSFQIHRAAEYLQLDSLVAEIEARLVHDFCHGLDWDRCHCRRCIQRVPRVWRFAGSSDVGALEVQRRARRFILAGWGDAWGREVGSADKSERDDLARDALASLNPQNVVSTLRGVAHVKARMEQGIRSRGKAAAGWVDALGEMIEPLEARARELLSANFAAVCDSGEMWDLLNGKGFNDDVLDLVLSQVVDISGTAPTYMQAPKIYQTMVSAILLKVTPDTLEAALPPRSANRRKIENAKDQVLANIKRRWMPIKAEGGFLGLEQWSLKEISDEINIPVDDLLGPRQMFPSAKDRDSFPRSTRPAAGSPHAHTRTATLSNASTMRSPRNADSPTEHNGLRRLRLSSSASVSSVSSTRAPRPASTPRAPLTGPQPRSPGAAEKTTVVSVGSRNRASISAAPGPSSPTPVRQPVRQSPIMSGPPRPLITGRAKAARTATPTPSEPPLKRQASAASIASTRTSGTSRTAVSSRPSTSATTSKTTSTLGAKPISAPRRPPVVGKTVVSTSSAATRVRTTSSQSTLSAAPTPAAPALNKASVVVKATSRPSLSAASTGKAVTTRPVAQPERPRPALRPSASSKSIRSAGKPTTPPMPSGKPAARSSAASTPAGTPKEASKEPVRARPPRPKSPVLRTKPAPKVSTPTPANTARVRATSLNNKSASPSPRPRTSSAAPWKRATPLPPSVAGVRGTSNLGPRPRPSLRSLSGSTEGPQEAVTPRMSEVSDLGIQNDTSSDLAIRSQTSPELADVAKLPVAVSPIAAVLKADLPTAGSLQQELGGGVQLDLVEKSKAEEPPTALETPISPSEPPAQLEAAVPSPVSPPKEATAPAEAASTVQDTREETSPTAAPVPAVAAQRPEPESPVSVRAAKTSIASNASSARLSVKAVPPVISASPSSSPARAAVLPGPKTAQPPVRASPTPTAAPLPPTRLSSASTTAPPSASKLSSASSTAPLPKAVVSKSAIAQAQVPLILSPGSPPVSLRRVTAPSRPPSALSGHPVVSRVASETGSLRSLNLNAGWHPAHAFDPPKKQAPPKVEAVDIPDDNKPQKSGVTLNIGIPCIVLSGRRRFRANIKYLGLMSGSKGIWVGVEVDDLDKLGVKTLPTGAVGGIRYFHFTPKLVHEDEGKAYRARKLAAISDEFKTKKRGLSGGLGLGLGLGLNLGIPTVSVSRAASPFASSEWAPPDNPRALFVRPSDVLFVLGAEAE